MTPPFWVPLLQAVVVFAYYLLITAVLIWAERRVVARMQSRLGPNRVGPFGILQTLVDGAKMFFKEDITPGMVNKVIYNLAPLVGVVAGFLVIAVIPIGGEVTLFGETFTLVVADLSIGVLWILALGSIHVYSVFLAGWASNSPYPLLGGIRSSAQMISYEIAQGLAVASVIIYTGSLRVSDIAVPEGVTVLSDPRSSVVYVESPAKLAAKEAALEAAAAAAAEAPEGEEPAEGEAKESEEKE